MYTIWPNIILKVLGMQKTYHAKALLLVEPQFAQHLVALFHHKSSLVSVRRNVTVHLRMYFMFCNLYFHL